PDHLRPGSSLRVLADRRIRPLCLARLPYRRRVARGAASSSGARPLIRRLLPARAAVDLQTFGLRLWTLGFRHALKAKAQSPKPITLVPVVFRLIRAVDRNADVIRLLLRQLRQLHTEMIQV